MNYTSYAKIKLMGIAVLGIALSVGLTPGMGSAVSCTVGGGSSTQTTGSDVGTGATADCGFGVASDQNPSSSELFTQTAISGLVQIDKDESNQINDSDNGFRYTGTLAGGNWFITGTVLDNYDNLVLVLKDGEVAGGNDTQWIWFKLDELAGCTVVGATASEELCGAWTMFTNAKSGKTSTLSHMELWGVPDGTADTPDTRVPEPSALLMLGAGLIALARFVKRAR